MVRRARLHARGPERGRQGGRHPKRRDGALRKGARFRGAACAHQAQAKGFERSAPAVALHVDVEVAVEDAVPACFSGLQNDRSNLRPPSPRRVMAVDRDARERGSRAFEVRADPVH
eukprot:4498361-Alexandrium_andersonii.AAC.1